MELVAEVLHSVLTWEEALVDRPPFRVGLPRLICTRESDLPWEVAEVVDGPAKQGDRGWHSLDKARYEGAAQDAMKESYRGHR